jgi:biopolymer transport protein ExbD
MAQAASGRSRKSLRRTPELDLLPVMNLFCVIIPFLLLSASFLEITVITMAQTEGISTAGAGATANLARSEEDRLQPKVILTEREMFVGTTVGTVHVCYSFQELRESGEIVVSYDWDSLSTKINLVYEQLSNAYPQIDFHKVIILTVEETRYENIVKTIDVCTEAGFDQPGLQVNPTHLVEQAMQRPGGGS